MLYHLAKDINVPIATPTPGAPRFAFDTASTLQCSVGPSLPNNRIIVKKTPQAIYLQHGTGNATIMSQPISYCGGEVGAASTHPRERKLDRGCPCPRRAAAGTQHLSGP